jgi:hypothetical protein
MIQKVAQYMHLHNKQNILGKNYEDYNVLYKYDGSSKRFHTFYFTALQLIFLMITKTKYIIFLHNHHAFQHICLLICCLKA